MPARETRLTAKPKWNEGVLAARFSSRASFLWRRRADSLKIATPMGIAAIHSCGEAGAARALIVKEDEK